MEFVGLLRGVGGLAEPVGLAERAELGSLLGCRAVLSSRLEALGWPGIGGVAIVDGGQLGRVRGSWDRRQEGRGWGGGGLDQGSLLDSNGSVLSALSIAVPNGGEVTAPEEHRDVHNGHLEGNRDHGKGKHLHSWPQVPVGLDNGPEVLVKLGPDVNHVPTVGHGGVGKVKSRNSGGKDGLIEGHLEGRVLHTGGGEVAGQELGVPWVSNGSKDTGRPAETHGSTVGVVAGGAVFKFWRWWRGEGGGVIMKVVGRS